jgi:hypothetical protein
MNLHIGIDQLVHSSVDRKNNSSHYEDFSSVNTSNNVVIVIIICITLQYGRLIELRYLMDNLAGLVISNWYIFDSLITSSY